MKEEYGMPGIHFSFKNITYSKEFKAVITFCYFMTICTLNTVAGKQKYWSFSYINLYFHLAYESFNMYMDFKCSSVDKLTYLDSITRSSDFTTLERQEL